MTYTKGDAVEVFLGRDWQLATYVKQCKYPWDRMAKVMGRSRQTFAVDCGLIRKPMWRKPMLVGLAPRLNYIQKTE